MTDSRFHALRRSGLLSWLALIAPAFAGSPAAHAPATPAYPPPSRLDHVVVTATRVEESAADLPYATATLERNVLDERSARTLPDALREESSVMVQKTALGQGSPFIRGFTGFRTVLLVDGFRLNNAAFRDGPNQYWNTVDAWSLDRLEVVKGPTSAQYGSDAVGGTVHAQTAAPRFVSGRPEGHARAFYRFASAERSHVARIEAGGGLGAATALLVGGTGKDFGDLRGGRDVRVQPKTGYGERDFDFKLEHRFAPHTRLTLAHQSVDQDDAWRTHATVYGSRWGGTRPGSNLARVLDQGRKLSYARFDAAGFGGALRSIHAGAAYQQQTEEEFRQRANLRIERQGFDVDTVGGYAHAQWETRFGRWITGVDYYHDAVDSFLREFDPTDTLAAVRVQGPVADDASHDLVGLFAEDRVDLAPGLDATLGGRLNHSRINAGRVAAPGTGRAFALASANSSAALNGRLLYALDDQRTWRLFAGASQGVRSPNLSDLTRFDIAEAGQIETPVSQLDPERFVTVEGGVRVASGNFAAEVVYYHTTIQDLIVRTPTGATVAGLAEVTKRNSGRGYIHGLEFDAQASITASLSLRGVFSWMEGRLESYPTAAPVLVEEPVSRLMPATFVGTARWQRPAWWTAATVTVAAKADRLATQDRVDTERIPPGGTPGFAVYGIRGGWTPTPRWQFTAALENLTNEDYRIHGSGLNEPGRNLVLSARVTF